MLKKIFLIILCASLGAIFLFSGYAKLFPIEPFEYTLVDLGIVDWQIAPFVARMFVGFELLLGFILLINYSYNKWVYKIGIATLVIFSIYLITLILFKGNTGDCGCFGSMVQLTPLEGLTKNVLMIAGLYILYKFHNGWTPNINITYPTIIGTLFFLSLPFILNSIDWDYSKSYLNNGVTLNVKIPLDSIYKNATLNPPPKKLSKGKHILAFLSLKCKHCKIAAKKLRIIKEQNPGIPVYFILNGDTTDLKAFFEDTASKDIPHSLLLGKSFIYLAGLELPTIYLINNSNIEHRINYLDLSKSDLEQWLKNK